MVTDSRLTITKRWKSQAKPRVAPKGGWGVGEGTNRSTGVGRERTMTVATRTDRSRSSRDDLGHDAPSDSD